MLRVPPALPPRRAVMEPVNGIGIALKAVGRLLTIAAYKPRLPLRLRSTVEAPRPRLLVFVPARDRQLLPTLVQTVSIRTFAATLLDNARSLPVLGKLRRRRRYLVIVPQLQLRPQLPQEQPQLVTVLRHLRLVIATRLDVEQLLQIAAEAEAATVSVSGT